MLYLQRDGIALHHGDCFEVLAQILPSLPPKTLVLTDPPYNCGKNYGNGTNDRKPWPEWCAWFDSFLTEITELPAAFSFLSQTALSNYLALGTKKPSWLLVWHKPLSLGICNAPFMPHWEPVCFWGTGSKSAGNFWGSDVLVHNTTPNVFGHPTEKPLPLILDLLSRFQDWDCVLDPFAGSGTTLVAARQLGMSAVGIEIEERYCAIAERRLSQMMIPFNAQESRSEQLVLGDAV